MIVAPNTAPLITKTHFQYEATSPRSVRTIEKNERLFTFDSIRADDIDGGNCENGIIVDGNRVYYNHHHTSHYLQQYQQQKTDFKISNGSSSNNKNDSKYKSKESSSAMEKENANDKLNAQRLRHKQQPDDTYYDEQKYSSYGKYYRKDSTGAWKNQFESNASNSGNSQQSGGHKTSKQYPSSFSSNSSSGSKKRFDDTMFPFDRESIMYDDTENAPEWTKNNFRHLSSHGNNYYETQSPDYDYYDSFRCSISGVARKSTASCSSTADGRLFKELSILSRKQQQQEEQRIKQQQQQQQQSTTAVTTTSKYEHPPSPSSIKNDQKIAKNHISDPDAFTPIPIVKSNSKSNCIVSNATTIITTTYNNNTTSISIMNTTNPNKMSPSNNTHVNNTNNCNDNESKLNSVSQFEQIASKFDQIPSKLSDAFRIYKDFNNTTNSSSQSPSSQTQQQPFSPSPTQKAQHDPTTQYSSQTSPLPDLRVDFFTEAVENAQKRHSFVEITMKQVLPLSDTSPSRAFSIAATTTTNNTHTSNTSINSGINVTPNPMDDTIASACSTQTPRATIVVQQVKKKSTKTHIQSNTETSTSTLNIQYTVHTQYT